jgi:hypothetical protein
MILRFSSLYAYVWVVTWSCSLGVSMTVGQNKRRGVTLIGPQHGLKPSTKQGVWLLSRNMSGMQFHGYSPTEIVARLLVIKVSVV